MPSWGLPWRAIPGPSWGWRSPCTGAWSSSPGARQERGSSLRDIQAIVQRRYASLGLGADWPPDPEGLGIVCDLDTGPLLPGEDDFREVSDDQAICTGYAVASPSTGWLPAEHWLAHRIVRGLEALRTARPDLRLGPDAKAAVLCEERLLNGDAGWTFPSSLTLRASTVSLQQAVGANEILTRRAVVEVVAEALAAAPAVFTVPDDLAGRVLVNGAGNFECGGTMGDNGLSGKKLVADAYGPRVPIGGGAWSGKDWFKVDRAGGVIARRIALAVVRSGAAREATVELLWRPGDREAQVVSLAPDDGALLDPSPFTSRIPLTLRDSGNRWRAALTADPGDLPGVMQRLAVEGHFGGDQPWERP